MSRLQKKCLIASGMLHGLLLLVLITTSAFLVKEEPPVDQQVLTFIPDKLVDDALARPAAAQPAQTTPPPVRPPEPPPTPPPPKPEPPTPKKEPEPPKKEPDPPKEKPKRTEPVKPKEPIKPEPKRPEPKPEPETPKWTPATEIKVSLKPTVVENTDRKRRLEKERAEREAAQKQFEADKQEALSQLSSIATKITTPSMTASALDVGTAGVSYGSYDAWVRQVYWERWSPPEDVSTGTMLVKAKVVIRKDGKVLSTTVVAPSGTARLDANVRELLKQVTSMGRPFPEGAKEETRSYTINFNLKAKLGV